MKLSKLLSGITLSVALVGAANAADIKIFYSPTCPHCHHARDFISSTLIYEYGDLKVEEVNVANIDNRQAFVDALYKCGYRKGGVPVLVIGEKCFQGYADTMQDEFRAAVEVDLSDEQKAAAVAAKSEMSADKDAYVAAHAERLEAIVRDPSDNSQKKNNE
jgi:glutaredoxin